MAAAAAAANGEGHADADAEQVESDACSKQYQTCKPWRDMDGQTQGEGEGESGTVPQSNSPFIRPLPDPPATTSARDRRTRRCAAWGV